ncbi:uncharacterized protein C8A04DRAFT_12931 [Dichotomopilus funicola]|uniref:C2H2-type domain-containing protein n=1 Tax=Dichotomopilus funicola TaxID=1934379 RepID=A0AAN6V0Y9_9PEZI|nr:hypothetical protein C8A04DRAFT_12931 [Dichotomopilus funicola]
MELPEMSVLDMSLEFANDPDFDFNGQPLGWPTGSVSGSSYASSSFGPHTPNSGRSTPHFSGSFDYGSSFVSVEPVSYDAAAPPSPTVPTYFHPNTKSTRASDLIFPACTVPGPWGGVNMVAQPFGSCSSQIMPSQPIMEYSFPSQQMVPHPYLPSPAALSQQQHSISGPTHWTYPDSPISFGQQSPVTRPVEAMRTSKRGSPEQPMTPRSPHMVETKGVPKTETSTKPKREKKRRVAAEVDEDEADLAVDAVEPASTFKCPIEGCNNRYRRTEHMKRHIQRANRFDNLVAHVRLHALPRKKQGSKPRVEFYEGAVIQHAEMVKKQQRRGGKKGRDGAVIKASVRKHHTPTF